MKKLYPLFIALLFFMACKDQPSNNNTFEELGKVQSSIIYSYKTVDSLLYQGVVDVPQYDAFIQEAIAFYEKYPEESLAPDMLNNAVNMSRVLADYYKYVDDEDRLVFVKKYGSQAIELCEKIIKVYPDYESLNIVYLNKAIIYDDIFGDKESAEMEYREYLHKFPNDPAGESYKELLDSKQAGKSAEEIYAGFELE